MAMKKYCLDLLHSQESQGPPHSAAA
jgi:hypothetical protein